MASGVSQPPSPPKQGRGITCEQYIETQLRKTSSGVKAVDIAFSLMMLVVATLGFFVLMAVVDHWIVPGGLGGVGRAIFFVLYAGGALAYIGLRVVPVILGKINPAFAAQTIEQSAPSLKNSLLNFLSFRGVQRGQVPVPVYHALEQQAASNLSKVPVDLAVDRSKILKVGYVLMALAVVFALYKVLSPKDPFVTAQRILLPWADILPPSRVKIEEIKPGSTEAVRGEQVKVSARIRGIRSDEEVRLIYTTDDGQAVERVLPMFAPEGGEVFATDLPESEAGLQEGLAYRIEAGDAVSHRFRMDVLTAPTIALKTVFLKYPEYTKLVDRNYTRDGNLRAIEGTQVTLRVETNAEIKTAWVDFENDRVRDLKMNSDGTKAWVTFPLEMDEERRGPKHSSYSFRFTSVEDRSNHDPVEYRIDVIPDLVPEIVFLQPEPSERETEVPLDGMLLIETSAIDPDFALGQVELHGQVGEKEVFLKPLLKKPHAGQFVNKYELVPSKENLKTGDVVEYWGVAVDNKTPKANRTQTERYRFTVTAPKNADPDQLAQNDRQQDPNADPQDDPNAQNNPDQNPNPEAGKPGQPDKQDPNQPQPPNAESQPNKKQNSGDDKPQEGEQNKQDESQDGGKKQEGGEPQDSGESGEPQDGGDGSKQDPMQGENGEGGSKGQSGADSESSSEAGDSDSESSAEGQSGENGKRGGKKSEGANPDDNSESGEPGAEGQPGDASKSQGKPSADGADPSEQTPQEVSKDDEGTVFDRLHKALKEKQEQEAKENADIPSKQEQPSENSQGKKPMGEQNPGERKQGEDPAGREPTAGEKPPGQQPEGGKNSEPGEEEQPGGKQGTEQQPNQKENPAGEKSQDPTADGTGAGGDQADPNAKPEKQPGKQPGGDKQEPAASDQPKPGEDPESEGQSGAGDKAKPGEKKPQDKQNPKDPMGGAGKPMGGEGEQEKGTGGTGSEMGDDPSGTPDAQSQPKPTDKQNKPGGEDNKSEEQPKSPAHGNKESDSEGQNDGDKPGGGKEGGGQKAPRPGTGSPGENTAADEGEGQSKETGGMGDKSNKGGNKKEGQQPKSEGEKKAGKGRDKRPGDQTPGSEQPGAGQQPTEGEQGNESGEPGKEGSKQGKPGETNQPMGNEDPAQNGGRSSSQGKAPGADDANLEYTKKATDLVLEYLEDQLKQDELSRDVQEQLPGWTKEDIQSLVDRTRTRQESAKGQGTESKQAQKELTDWLRSLGLKKNSSRGISQEARGTQDNTSGLRQSRGSRPPAEYADQLEAYKKGLSKKKP